MIKLFGSLMVIATLLFTLNKLAELERRVQALENLEYQVVCVHDRSFRTGLNRTYKCVGNGAAYSVQQ